MTNSTSDEREQRPKWDQAGLKEACQRGLAIGRTRQEFDLQLLLDMLLEIERLEALSYVTHDFEWALRELADGWIANNEREGPYGFNQNARRVLETIANDVRQEERRAALERYAKVLCGFCEQGKPLEFMDVPNCFKHRLEGETPWHTCWANDIRMAERAPEAAANETREDGDDG